MKHHFYINIKKANTTTSSIVVNLTNKNFI